MDAPVGYLASIKNWSNKNKIDFEELINKEDVKLVHFIGKDIVYFHSVSYTHLRAHETN